MSRISLREEHRQLTQARIIDAARHLFFQGGYVPTSMEEIARAADVSRTTLYQHFPSKTAIMQAILDVEIPRFGNYLEFLTDECLDRRQVERLLRTMQQHYRDNIEFVAILRQAVASEEAVALRIDQSFRTVIEVLLMHLPHGKNGEARGREVTRTRIYICLSAADSMLEKSLHAQWGVNREMLLSELVALWCSMFDIPDTNQNIIEESLSCSR